MIDVQQAVLEVNPIQDHNQAMIRLALFDGNSGQPYPFSGEEWKDIPQADLQNGWDHLEDNPPPQYRKRPNGQVEMRGVVSGGQVGTIFNFPEGYRHNYAHGALHFPVIGQLGMAHVCVMPDGNLDLVNFLNQPDTDWISLATVVFSNS